MSHSIVVCVVKFKDLIKIESLKYDVAEFYTI